MGINIQGIERKGAASRPKPHWARSYLGRLILWLGKRLGLLTDRDDANEPPRVKVKLTGLE